MAIFKFPPPPFLSGSQQAGTQQGPGGLTPDDLQRLNRWLIEIQSILNSAGLIDPAQVVGLPELFAQVSLNTAHLVVLDSEVAQNTTDIAANVVAIAAVVASVAALDVRVTAVEARNQIRNGAGVPGAGLGNNGDMYINNSAGPGSYLYAKISGVWTLMP